MGLQRLLIGEIWLLISKPGKNAIEVFLRSFFFLVKHYSDYIRAQFKLLILLNKDFFLNGEYILILILDFIDIFLQVTCRVDFNF